MGIFPKDRGENKKYLKPPTSQLYWVIKTWSKNIEFSLFDPLNNSSRRSSECIFLFDEFFIYLKLKHIATFFLENIRIGGGAIFEWQTCVFFPSTKDFPKRSDSSELETLIVESRGSVRKGKRSILCFFPTRWILEISGVKGCQVDTWENDAL